MRAIACILALLLMACAAPRNDAVPENAADGPTPAMADAPAPAVATAAPAAAVVPMAPAAEPVTDIAKAITGDSRKPSEPGVVDASCKTDADCAIKDVGSCCGYNPRCVNKDSPTFPEQVKASCGKEGRVGICGFPAISSCHCEHGTCAGDSSGASVQ